MTIKENPAEFPPVPKKEINLEDIKEIDPVTGETKVDQERVIPYVCDFVEEYINSDVLVSHFFVSKRLFVHGELGNAIKQTSD